MKKDPRADPRSTDREALLRRLKDQASAATVPAPPERSRWQGIPGCPACTVLIA